MTRAVLSLGSNLGDRLALLRGALEELSAAQPSAEALAVSGVYETAPWGPVPQGDYLNIVAIVDDPDADAGDWLTRAHRLERSARREREVRWGPRTLDVDVVAVWNGDQAVLSKDPVLTLPHPRAHERGFVLIPWLDADSAAVLPGSGAVSDLVAGLDADEVAGVRRRADLSVR